MSEENMKANNAQQELLLVMETNFTSMLWSESNPSSFARFISENDYIEDACWNNILSEVLPELSQMQCPKQDLYLWEIRTCDHFLKLCFAELIFERDNYLTIDPYLFRRILTFN